MISHTLVTATLAVLVAATTASRFGQLKSSLTKTGETTPFVDVGPQNVPEDAYYMWQCMMASMAEYKMQKEGSELAAEMGLRNKAAQDYVCYTDLGCFYKNGTLSSMNKLPHNTKTVFYLWTFADQQNPQVLDWKKPATISGSLFRADRPTVAMIHGFTNDINTDWVPEIKAAVFRGNPQGVNFIFVDWGRGASGPDYWQAASNTQVAGAQVAKLISTINEVMHTSSSSFQLIGFSLGAHVSGFTGYRLGTYGHPRVGKITALDPAGPMFENVHPDARLSPDDANFVQAFHVNGATLTFGGFGLYSRVGHIDFYPNGGRYQPGCPNAIFGAIGDIWNFNFTNMPDSVACNHGRAIDLGVASADQNCLFTSHSCSNHSDYRDAKCFTQQKGVMGIFANNAASSEQQFLVTRGTTGSFCGRVVRMTFKFTLLQIPTSGSFFLTLVDKFGNEENVGQIVKDESMTPGGALMRVILTQEKVNDLVAAKVRYEPEKGIFWDSSDTVKVNSIRFTSQESDKGELCGLYQLLTKGETVTFDLNSKNCRSIWAKK